MSVNSAKISPISYELDIVKVAQALGIDQERLFAHVYSRTEDVKTMEETNASTTLDLK